MDNLQRLFDAISEVTDDSHQINQIADLVIGDWVDKLSDEDYQELLKLV